MSLCNRCAKPGACCDGFELFGSETLNRCETTLEALAFIASNFGTERRFDMGVMEGVVLVVAYPFIPIGQNDQGDFVVHCPLLDKATGRCTEYEFRPPTCRNFEPGTGGPICVHYARDNCGIERPPEAFVAITPETDFQESPSC